MPPIRASLAAGAIAFVLCANPAFAQFSNIYSFGDSLSDAGSFVPVLPPGTGLFTTNPGPIWIQVLARRYGLTAIPADQGGTDYAQGGARVTDLPGVPDSPPTGTATPIAAQVSQLLAHGALDGNALYTVWGGANDIFTQLGELQAGAITPAQLQANVTAAAGSLAGQVALLESAGARYVVVFNLPDIGKTPFGVASGQGLQISAISSLYNSALLAGLDALHVSTIRVNIFGFLNEVMANPAAYGIANISVPACGATPSLLCTQADLVAPNAASTFLFADGVHPTTAGHAMVAQLVASMLEGPSKMGALAEAPLAVEQANFQAIDSRMMSSLASPGPQARLEGWASYDYGHNDLGGRFLSGNSDLNGLHAGGDVRLSDRLLAGAAFGYAENKGDFGGSSGGYKLKETSGTAYIGYGMAPWYVGATLGAGDLDYNDVHRDIQLGAMNRVESATTRGWHMTGSVLGGYWFDYRGWLHGPFARVAYQKIHVDAFAERGSDSTALYYGEQDRSSLTSELGWQVSGRIASLRPFARATWEHEGRADSRMVSASSVSLGGSYSMPVLAPDSSYMRYELGASSDFGHVTGYVTGSTTSGRSDGNGYTVTVGLRVPL
ncbi:MAG: autotransporter domain-containing protein [Casimicrobiaceae bacterium]